MGALAAGTSRFCRTRVLIVGDAMMDEYLVGDAERISPEAPVPVVLVGEEKRLVGGAGNVARNITALGASAVLVGVRGNDPAGETMEACLAADGIDSALLPLKDRRTTRKTRILARQQQMLRIDREDSAPLDDSDRRRLLESVRAHAGNCGAIVISDYGKGVVSEAFMHELHSLLRELQCAVPVLVDPKPQNTACYAGVTLLTPNAKETSEATGLPVKTPEQTLRAGRTLMEKLGCPHLVTTLGAQGMAVFLSPDEVWHLPTAALEVFDVTGAGDTVISVTALGLAAGMSLLESCCLANYAAGLVVGEVGAATVSRDQLLAAMRSRLLPAMLPW
jgi:rfaE bifunctional protein kinase chain/domain